ncbi:RNA pyrophosphohydrolase [Tabrizicola sp.]|jgi:putative (di)nucleoside polyphosphate hydrolase|uniref:RNA pyrophosphohydrolase n=1 Tax=Tabrizicola sp. TaxID=2005166 RepID=UPI000BDA23AB|nr:RNA pyrophosphohydrolase [Tabrizicola sp.]MBY0349350.1 RNA pyrophosphohydrolase [Tabrizicola sp.]MDK2775339.1 RNA pyrophosphohydrolase [Tabrizicola sp.]OYX22170.1 MAG: RNA pyrophosphohydrolase [Rhodobacterales bacterium 32-66-9]
MVDADSLPYRPCVGVVLIDARGLVFAGQRIDSPSPAWQMPQGGIDDGEKPREAAYRELWEETGIPRDLVEFVGKTHGWVTYDLPPELLGRVWGGKYRGQKQKWFLFRFKGTDADVQIATEHPEFSSWRWILADEMVQGIVPFKRAVYDAVVRSFRAYLA